MHPKRLNGVAAGNVLVFSQPMRERITAKNGLDLLIPSTREGERDFRLVLRYHEIEWLHRWLSRGANGQFYLADVRVAGHKLQCADDGRIVRVMGHWLQRTKDGRIGYFTEREVHAKTPWPKLDEPPVVNDPQVHGPPFATVELEVLHERLFTPEPTASERGEQLLRRMGEQDYM